MGSLKAIMRYEVDLNKPNYSVCFINGINGTLKYPSKYLGLQSLVIWGIYENTFKRNDTSNGNLLYTYEGLYDYVHNPEERNRNLTKKITWRL